MHIHDDEIVVETGKLKILLKVWKKHIFPGGLYITWALLSCLILLIRILSLYVDILKIHWLPFSSLIFPGVTGLSFSVTMLNATRNLFDIKDLVAMFTFTDPDDSDICDKGDILYRTLVPYITASFLWLVISVVAFVSSLVEVDISNITWINITLINIIKEILYSLYYSIVIAGLLNLWYLISTHLEDISIKVELELNKKKEKQQ